MKTCNDCKIEKEDLAFNKNQRICRKCQNARYRKTYHKNHDKYKHRNLDRRTKFKEYAKSLLADKKCQHCGEDDPITFDYHHIDPKQKEISISRFINNMYPNEANKKKLHDEIEKCIILCSNCHRKEHARLDAL